MKTADNIQLDRTDALIRAVWVRGQVLQLTSGALALVTWAIPLLLVGMLIDWLSYMPTPGRFVILLIIVVISLRQAWRCGWQHLRSFNAVYTALQIEASHGNLQSLLVSAIQLRSQPVGKSSTDMCAQTCQLAEQKASGLQPQKTVPFNPLQKPGIIVALLLGIVAAFAVVNGPFLAAGLARIFTPWTTIEYPTNTQIALAQDELVIKEGSSAAITAQLTGIIPDEATIYIRTGDSKARAIDVEIVDDAATYAIESASRDFTYRFKAGDDRTNWHTVRVVRAPRIQKVAVDLKYPAYLDRPNETIEALTLTVPEGTDVVWNLTLDQPIRAATFVRDGETPIDLQVDGDGTTLSFTTDVAASQGYHFTWVDKEQGYTFTSPRYFLQVASDQEPRVEITSPASNLVAMLGRPMTITVRAQDDHGIGSAKILYRVNQLEEKTFELRAGLPSGQGEQAIDWDYRQALPDLQTGDTVSFLLQISDKYPGEQGPHVARSETRRISFLSKEQYLEQINKRRNRLLSRVQTIYRQQRTAHEDVRELTPNAAGYQQACQLEAIRQEMTREQLKRIGSQMQALVDDLALNGVADEAQADGLKAIRAELMEIAEMPIAQAAELLRDQSAQSSGNEAHDSSAAAAAVNTAARQLASLVLLRSIESAHEVYVREARMLAKQQAELRWQTTANASAKQSPALAERQNELAEWTTQLIRDLEAGIHYDRRPLVVLSLLRSLQDLKKSQTVEQMRAVAKQIQQQPTQAAAIQAKLVKALLAAEFSVRISGDYSTLLDVRRLIASMAINQKQLHSSHANLPANAAAEKRQTIVESQTALRKQLLTLMLPEATAPRAKLFDLKPTSVRPVDAIVNKADAAMASAIEKLDSGDQQAALAQQAEAASALDRLLVVVNRWTVQSGLQSQGLGTLVAVTSERRSRIDEFLARLITLLDKVDQATTAEENVSTLTQPQQDLASDFGAFIKALKKQDQYEPDPDLPPLLNRLEVAEGLLNLAAKAIAANQADAAIGHQEQAADALAEASEIVGAQNERLSYYQGMLMFQRSVGFANNHMANVVAQQRDLLAATEAAKANAMIPLQPKLQHVHACMEEVAPLLTLIAPRLDVGTPLVLAKTDLGDAIYAVKAGDKFEAVDAQDVAAESLSDIQLLAQDVGTQIDYLAEIVEYLHESVSAASTVAFRQKELRQELASAGKSGLQRLAETQRTLLTQSAKRGKELVAATGIPAFLEPAKEMQKALKAMQANDLDTAAEQMELVELLYVENAEAMLAAITMLDGIPSLAITATTQPEIVRLVDALAVASPHKRLLRRTQSADDPAFPTLAGRQSKLASRLEKIAANGEPNPRLNAANKHLAEAVAAFKAADRDSLQASQSAADEQLRHFVINQAIILETAAPPPAPGSPDSADGSPTGDGEAELSAGFIADFVSGQAPTDKRSEWKVLAERNRAALNQNFARELPLEYRGLLKNYYERVAK